MGTVKGAAPHPFVAHLREIEAHERDLWTAADEACAKARYAVDEMRERVADAEQELVEAEQRRLIAEQRVSVAVEMLAGVESLASEPSASSANAHGAPHADGEDRPQGDGEADPGSRTLKTFVLAAFSEGETLAPIQVTPRVQVHRPGTTHKAVRSTLTSLRRDGSLKLVQRGSYRLPGPKERL
ncbi:hypothetical protein ACIP6P_17925 [Streptomyces sp. NPDC088729]|uniref:hypothetical protein n=1 Tax=Streptomyces sp. NPDC088729 TaxID=3365876 RepID=UPI0037FB993D